MIDISRQQAAYDNDDGIRDVRACWNPSLRRAYMCEECWHDGSCAVQRADAADNAADSARDARDDR